MLESVTNMPWFMGWKVTWEDGGMSRDTLLGAVDCVLPSTCQTSKPNDCPSRMSIKLVVQALFLWPEWIQMFSKPAWWLPLLKSISQQK